MTFETSQLRSLTVTYGNKTTIKSVMLSEESRYTLGIKTNTMSVVAELVSLLNSQAVHSCLSSRLRGVCEAERTRSG